MKKPTSLLLVFALVATLFSSTALADEGVTDTSKPPSDESTEATTTSVSTADDEYIEDRSEMETPEPKEIRDFTDKTITTGVHATIRLPNYQDGFTHIPSFTLVHRTKDGKEISTLNVEPKHFDKDTGTYNLIFKNPGFKLNDEYQVYLQKADKSVKTLTMFVQWFEDDINLMTEETTLKVDNYSTFKVREVAYFEGENDEIAVLDLQPSEYFPLKGDLETDSTKVAIKLVSETGAPLKNEKVTLRFTNRKTLDVTSDNTGIAWVNKKDMTPDFQVYSETKRALNTPDGVAFFSNPYHSMSIGTLEFTVTLDSKPQSATNIASMVNVKVNVDGKTDLSSNWVTADLDFKNEKGEITTLSINDKDAILALQNGKYTVTAKSPYATVKLNQTTVTVKDNTVNLTATLTPKYVLEIGKEGKPFKFKVLNVATLSEKVIEGTTPIKYGVTPSESYIIEDVSTNEVYTVVIDEKTTLTKLILGVGVVTGENVTSPHTGDAIVYLTILLIITLIAAGVSFFIYSKNKRLKNQTATVLLSIILITSLFPTLPQTVKASSGVGTTGIGSGTPGVINPGKNTPVGNIQTHETFSLLQVSFTNGKIDTNGEGRLNTEESTIANFEDTTKFHPQRLRNALYVAPNKQVRDKFLSSNSSFAVFDGEYLKPIYGVIPFDLPTRGTSNTNREHLNIKGTLAQRTLLINETAQVNKNDNDFNLFMRYVLSEMGANTSNRQLWQGYKSSSIFSAGDAIKRTYNDEIVEGAFLEKYREQHMYSPDDDLLGENADSIIFYSYISHLFDIGQKDLVDSFYTGTWKDSQHKDDYVFLFQVVQAFYVKGDQSKMMFMPMSDALHWYMWGRTQDNPKKIRDLKVKYNREEEALTKLRVDTYGDNKFAKHAPVSTYIYNVNRTSAKAIKPEAKNVPINKPTTTATNLAKNPFAGWGFIPFKRLFDTPSHDTTPKLYAKMVITVLDENGKPTSKRATKSIAVPYLDNGQVVQSADGAPLWLTGGDKTPTIKGSTTVVIDKKLYTIPEENNAYITLEDVYDSADFSHLAGTKNPDRESLLKLHPDGVTFDLLRGTKGLAKIDLKVPRKPGEWSIDFGFDIPHADQMDRYLSGETTGEDSKYGEYRGKVFANAHLTLHVEAYEVNQCTDPKDPKCYKPSNSMTVPQWKLSQYFSDISPSDKTNASFSLALPSSSGYNQYISPSGKTTFSLIDPDLKDQPWATSKAKLFNKDTATKDISLNSTYADFVLAGDLLAVKENTEISSIKLASWKNNNDLLDKRITTSSTGVAENKPTVTKNHIFQYKVKNPNSKYTFHETRESWECTGVKPNQKCDWEPYSWSGAATPSYGDTFYNTTVTFNRYIPKNSAAIVTQAPKKQSDNGFYWETKQDSTKLEVNPEVLMAYDDANGNTSVAYVTGDKLRQIQPVHYNVAKFVNPNVAPKVDGMSTATDQKAKQLAASLGAGSVGVVYKGSAITTNFEVTGQLELKSYALDIGSSALKTAWGNTQYDTNKVNEEFLTRYATKQADGTWNVNLQAEGKLKINGKEYGGQKGNLQVKQKSSNVIEHTLEIRGGKLHAVNGNTNLASLPQDLKDALERMNISTAVGTNVFSTFERAQGDKLTDSKVVTLGNAVRGTTDLKVGEGWYNEDTSLIVLREYTNTYDLPSHMYVDKIPQEVPGLETPMDKNQFFSKGFLGYTKLRYTLVDSFMEYDGSLPTPYAGVNTKSMVVPNVSILDSFQ